jgi:hypothetical protein
MDLLESYTASELLDLQERVEAEILRRKYEAWGKLEQAWHDYEALVPDGIAFIDRRTGMVLDAMPDFNVNGQIHITT